MQLGFIKNSSHDSQVHSDISGNKRVDGLLNATNLESMQLGFSHETLAMIMTDRQVLIHSDISGNKRVDESQLHVPSSHEIILQLEVVSHLVNQIPVSSSSFLVLLK